MPVEINPLFTRALDEGVIVWTAPFTYRIVCRICKPAVLAALRRCGVAYMIIDDLIRIV